MQILRQRVFSVSGPGHQKYFWRYTFMKHIYLFIACAASTIGLALPVQADTLDQIREKGVIRLAHRDGSVPLSYVDETGRPLGFSVEICNRLVSHLREQMKLPSLRIEWIKVSAAQRMQMVKDNQADMECGSTTNNAERRQQYMFTMPTYIAGIKIMSRQGVAAQNLTSLANKRVAASAGTTAAKLLAISRKEGLVIDLVETKDHSQSWALLDSGQVDAWLTDDVILASYRAKSTKPQNYVLSDRFLSIEPYGFVMRQGDEAIVTILNREISRMMRTGEFKRLYEIWFQQSVPGSNINLQLPMNELLRAQVRSPSEVLPSTF